MNTGQINIALTQTVTQLVTQDQAVQVAGAMAGGEQNGANFAGLLNGIQAIAKVSVPSATGKTVQPQIGVTGKDQSAPNVTVEEPPADLTAQFQVSSHIAAASDSIAPKPDVSEKTVVADVAALPDVASQMALAAYLLAGRMPELNIPTSIPADAPQNVVKVTEQAPVIAAPAVATQSEQGTAGPVQASSQQPEVSPGKEVIAKSAAELNQYLQPETARSVTDDKRAVTTEEAVPVSPIAINAEQHAENANLVRRTTDEKSAQTSTPQSVQTDRMSQVKNINPHINDRLQNVANVPEQPAVIAAPPAAKISLERGAAEPTQGPSAQLSVTQVKEVVVQSVDAQNQHHRSETAQATVINMQSTTNVEAAPATPGTVKAEQHSGNIDLVHRTSVGEPVPGASLQPAQSDRMSEAGNTTPLSFAKLQNVAAASKQPAEVAAPTVTLPAEQVVVKPEPALHRAVPPVQSENMSETSKTIPLIVDKPQNETGDTEQPAVIAAPVVKLPTEQVMAESVFHHAVQPVQSDKMFETGTATSLIVDKPQNVAGKSAQPAVIVAPVVKLPTEQVVAELALHHAAQSVQSDDMSETSTKAPLIVDKPQDVAWGTEQSVVIAAPTVKLPTEQVVAEPALQRIVQMAESDVMSKADISIQPYNATLQNVAGGGETSTVKPPTVQVVAEPAAPSTIQMLQADSMPNVNIPTPLPVDKLQNVSVRTEQPAVAAPVVALQSGRGTEVPAHHQEAKSEPSGRVTSVNKLTSLVADTPKTETKVVDISALFPAPPVKAGVEQTIAEPVETAPVEKLAVPAVSLKSEQPSVHQAVSVPVSSPASELEISLSQPRPITARAAAAPVLADNRSAALVQEIRSVIRQRINPEQQIEKVQSGSNDQSTVKETASLLQAASSSSGLPGDSDTSRRNDNNQGQPDADSSNLMSAQQMRGQLGTEHQKVAALTTKVVQTEPVRQDIPEQIVQQVKERLVQHDVKPGNQQITLTLSPDSLGELKMNLNLQGQKLSVEIVTENRTVRDAIVQHTDALKESLARQNITMESFDVTTGGKGSEYQGQNQSAWRELAKQQQQQFWTSTGGNRTSPANISSGQLAYQNKTEHKMLDIHY